jgi:phospholipase C
MPLPDRQPGLIPAEPAPATVGGRHAGRTPALQPFLSLCLRKAVAGAFAVAVTAMSSGMAAAQSIGSPPQDAVPTATPIKHLVVLFQENVSFDHYFATYPHAANPPGEPVFTAAPGTPAVNNLATAGLLTGNPNFTNKENGAAAANPFRLDRSQAATADQTHTYTEEQLAYNGGRNDLFPKYAGRGMPGAPGPFGSNSLVMGYFDGNTVTAIWNYAQHFAMSDNAFTDTYGPSTLGALEIAAGQTNGVRIVATTRKPSTRTAISFYIKDGQGGYTMINDVDPAYDLCSRPSDQVLMAGRSIGDLLNAAGITWGGFMGGFDLGVTNPNGSTGCRRNTRSPVVGTSIPDYRPHHNWFQYFPSTANPRHLRPLSLRTIGYSFAPDGRTRDPANHQYDLRDFYAAVAAGNFPSVSYIKMPAYQDGHAGYSNPLDAQSGVVALINFLEHQPDWKSTAVILTWDDSDGWYDHAFAAVTSPSFDPEADQLDGPGRCGSGTPPPGVAGRPVNGRCGPGTRIPFLVISPWAKANYVGHRQISLASVVRLIEDNWLNAARLGGGSFDAGAGPIADLFDFSPGGGRNPPLFLDPGTGMPVAAPPSR